MSFKKSSFAILLLSAFTVFADDVHIMPPEPLIDVTFSGQGSAAFQQYIARDFFDDTADREEMPLSAELLLAECVSRMPLEPLEMSGTMTMRKMYGTELKKFNFTVFINWGAVQPMARYEILTTGNELIETIHAVRHKDGSLLLSRFSGSEMIPIESPVLSSRIMGTDLTWLDIALDYIWWKNPKIVGSDKVKGRKCDILEVEPPSPIPGCSKARLWIDRGQSVVIQASQINEKGKEVRKMWVRSIKKIDNRWVTKDIEVETSGSGHRTRLSINNVTSVEIEDERND